jgi:hypothetical protein
MAAMPLMLRRRHDYQFTILPATLFARHASYAADYFSLRLIAPLRRH